MQQEVLPFELVGAVGETEVLGSESPDLCPASALIAMKLLMSERKVLIWLCYALSTCKHFTWSNPSIFTITIRDLFSLWRNWVIDTLSGSHFDSRTHTFDMFYDYISQLNVKNSRLERLYNIYPESDPWGEGVRQGCYVGPLKLGTARLQEGPFTKTRDQQAVTLETNLAWHLFL